MLINSVKRVKSSFIAEENKPEIALYRLIGNDMPPLQSSGQLLYNTLFALDNEPSLNGAVKKWILNRIWNETSFTMLYNALLLRGVRKNDIILRCFDMNEYKHITTFQDRMVYLTSQNDARNDALKDGKLLRFNWSIILDGNTFITGDSWNVLAQTLTTAEKMGQKYAKIPYHRVHQLQSSRWLSNQATMSDVLAHAPMKGESQVAFHITATESFSLGNTRPDGKAGKKKGYGQRNKSYLFKDDQVCSKTSTECVCAEVEEGNEEDMAKVEVNSFGNFSYTDRCGLVLRLWSFPTEAAVSTGLPIAEEEGFFCFFERHRRAISGKTECARIQKALARWLSFPMRKRQAYRGNAATSRACKERYKKNVLTHSCIRAAAREKAQKLADTAIQLLYKESLKSFIDRFNDSSSVSTPRDAMAKIWGDTFCHRLAQSHGGSGEGGIEKSKDVVALTVFNIRSISVERKAWNSRSRLNHTVEYALLQRVEHSPHTSSSSTPLPIILETILESILTSFLSGEQKHAEMALRSFQDVLVRLKGDKSVDSMIEMLEYENERGGNMLLYFIDAVTLLQHSTGIPPTLIESFQAWLSRFGHSLLSFVARNYNSLRKATVPLDAMSVAIFLYLDKMETVALVRSRLFNYLQHPHPSGYFMSDGRMGRSGATQDPLLDKATKLLWWMHIASLMESVRVKEGGPCSSESFWLIGHTTNSSEGELRILSRRIEDCGSQKTDAAASAPTLCKAMASLFDEFQVLGKERVVDLDHRVMTRMRRIYRYGRAVYKSSALFRSSRVKSLGLLLEEGNRAVEETDLWQDIGTSDLRMMAPRTCSLTNPLLVELFNSPTVAEQLTQMDRTQEVALLETLKASKKVSSSVFQYATAAPHVAIYRIIKNSLPNTESDLQLLNNLLFILRNEPFLAGVRKKWILHRIWNETYFLQVMKALVESGVSGQDILVECFDWKTYVSLNSSDSKSHYMNAEASPREVALRDGLQRLSFQWALVMDINTFITRDSWIGIKRALRAAERKKTSWMKIPLHSDAKEKNTFTWLNSETEVNSLLHHAQSRRGSEVVFHRSALSAPDSTTQQRIYSIGRESCQRIDNPQCYCSQFKDEATPKKGVSALSRRDFPYIDACGCILTLPRHHAEGEVLPRGVQGSGFFCFWDRLSVYSRKGQGGSDECLFFNAALKRWLSLNESLQERLSVTGEEEEKCKEKFQAQGLSICLEKSAVKEASDSQMKSVEDHLLSKKRSLCESYSRTEQKAIAVHSRPLLKTFDENSLRAERNAWLSGQDSTLKEYIDDLLGKANRGLHLGPYSVIHKLQVPNSDGDKRYYYSFRPYLWPYNLLPDDLRAKVDQGQLRLDPPCCLHRDGHRVPGSIIGGEGENNFDRSSAWYVVDNVTTLALAWYFTGDKRYAEYAAHLADVYFLNDTTGMHPSLRYAQGGYKYGLIDWKDVYYFLDSLTLLEMSGSITNEQVKRMTEWCSRLGHWILESDMGNDEAKALNNHGLYFDLYTFSLFLYSQEDYFIHTARARLLFRLSRPSPVGHFALDGSQPHEYNRPTGLHYAAFNLIGWIHSAEINEAVRMRSSRAEWEVSFWLVKHETESQDPSAEPVLCKAIRWLCQYLPANTSHFEWHTVPSDGMGVSWPYEQLDAFSFDRILEIFRYGVRIYGLEGLYPDGDVPTNVIQSLRYPFYSTKLASFSNYSSVHPDSGSRSWNTIGMVNLTKPVPYAF